MGFIEETGAAQYYRDARIAPIYEGTNGIQAIDLVMRKVPMEGGAVVEGLISEIREVALALSEREGLEDFSIHLTDGAEALEECLDLILEQREPNDALAGATPFLRLMGTVIGGWLMGKAALAADSMIGSGDGDERFLRSKLATARFYGEQLLPSAYGLIESVTADASQLFAIADDDLAM